MNDKPTREQVIAEPAGRTMDTWVAEFVFDDKCPIYVPNPQEVLFEPRWNINRTWYCISEYDKGDVPTWYPAHFSEDIAVAMKVLNGRYDWFYIQFSYGEWKVKLSVQVGEHAVDVKRVEAFADTEELAICRAALLAVIES